MEREFIQISLKRIFSQGEITVFGLFKTKPPQMSEEEVTALMGSSRSKEEWAANYALVEKAFGGCPNFWMNAIVHSGLREKTTAQFKS